MDAANLKELQAIPLFSDLSEAQVNCFERGEIIEIEAGKVLATEGESLEAFYLLLKGEMRASRNYSNQAILMGVMKPGMFMGEISLLLDSPNLATVRALKPCRLFRLGQ